MREVLEALPGTAVDHGPLVSIVILNRNGREHLERCLGAVASTTYRDVEIIVVDNGSTDGSPELAESFELPFPIRIIRNDRNRSFSDANAQGVEVAAGTLICFLNNDVDPITDDWLGYMVETMLDREAVAVGARLIYPRHRGGVRAGSDLPDLSLQHAGVDFDRAKAVPLGRVIGAGVDAVAPWAAEVEDRPALTGACLLVRVDAFHEVGGFSPEYFYGTEDVDLCLKLRAAGGRLVYDGRAALWHHESATRAVDRARFSARISANREAFIGLWGPRIFRDALLDALVGGERFSADPFHVAITLGGAGQSGADEETTGRCLGDALEANGWRVSFLSHADDVWSTPDTSVEAVIVQDASYDLRQLPRNMVTIAWIQKDAERWVDRPWFDDFDLVFASTAEAARTVRERSAKAASVMLASTRPTALRDPFATRATAIRDGLIEWATATRYGLRIEVASWEMIDGDDRHRLARDLQRSLERAGHPTRLHFLSDWHSPTAARDDVAVHLLGHENGPTHPGQVNILWQVGGPAPLSAEVQDRYDHIFTGSDARTAEDLCEVAERLLRARPSGIDGYPVAS